MTRYYFDLHDTLGVWPDEEGMDMATLEAAEDEAALTLAQMVQSDLVGKRRHRVAVQVRTADGPLFEAAVTFELKPLY